MTDLEVEHSLENKVNIQCHPISITIESDQLRVCSDRKIATDMTEPIHSNGQKTTTMNNIPTTEMKLGSSALNEKATDNGTSIDKIRLALKLFNCKGFKQCFTNYSLLKQLSNTIKHYQITHGLFFYKIMNGRHSK